MANMNISSSNHQVLKISSLTVKVSYEFSINVADAITMMNTNRSSMENFEEKRKFQKFLIKIFSKVYLLIKGSVKNSKIKRIVSSITKLISSFVV